MTINTPAKNQEMFARILEMLLEVNREEREWIDVRDAIKALDRRLQKQGPAPLVIPADKVALVLDLLDSGNESDWN